MVTRQKIFEIFEKTGALKEGHFILTSGLHSPVYFQCALVLQYPEYCELIAQSIKNHFVHKQVDVVIAPAVGGIVIAQEVGRQLNKRTIFTERQDGRMTLRRGFTLRAGEHVLICEDVVTTGGSVKEVIDVVIQFGAIPVGVGYIVDRSSGSVNFSVDQYALVRLDTKTYVSDKCPLCADNIPVKKPGSRSL